MISLKKYLEQESESVNFRDGWEAHGADVLPAVLSAYRTALRGMGDCTVEACPALGSAVQQRLTVLEGELSRSPNEELIEQSENTVSGLLRDWGRNIALHYQQKAREVKDILLVMARTADSVGQRDERYVKQLNEVTARLKGIANLEDLSSIRSSIETSVMELRGSIDRMTAEGKAVVDHLRVEVSMCQAKLEAAEYIAACDGMTGLGSRLWIEGQIQRRIERNAVFCAALLDIDEFKRVNDEHGHLVGDLLLKQFAAELRSACRSTDCIGRWGGDEFVLVLDCDLEEATSQTARVQQWVCGSYTVPAGVGRLNLQVSSSLGLAQHQPSESLQELLARADAAMYRSKPAARSRLKTSRG